MILIVRGCASVGSRWSVWSLMAGSPLIWMVARPFFFTLRRWALGSEIRDLERAVLVWTGGLRPADVGTLEVGAVGLVYFAGDGLQQSAGVGIECRVVVVQVREVRVLQAQAEGASMCSVCRVPVSDQGVAQVAHAQHGLFELPVAGL